MLSNCCLLLLLVATPGDPVIARVNGEEIAASAVTTRAASGRVSPQVALDDLVAEVLLGAEGAKKGVKPPPSAAIALDRARRAAAVQRYLEVVVHPDVEVPEADLRARFHQRGDQVRLHLVARTDEAQARATLDRIAAGGSFADEARTSADPTSLAKSGDMGWMPRSALPSALAKEVFAAPLGKALGPVAVENLQVVYLVQDRRLPDEAAFALVKDRLRQDLEPAARASAVEGHKLALLERRKARVDEQALQATGDTLLASPSHAEKVVASAGPAKVRYGQIVGELGGGHGGQGRASPLVKATLARTLLGNALLEAAALERFAKDPAVKAAVARAERAAVAAAYADRLRFEAPGPSTAEVEGRYEARRREYVKPGGRRCFQLVAATEEGARKLAARVAAGEAFAGVAADSADRRTAGKGGEVGFVTDDEVKHLERPDGEPALAAAVTGVAPGQLSAPVRTRAGYRVLRCEPHVAEQGQTLDEVRHRITMELKGERSVNAVRQRAAALRDAAEVEIDQPALAALGSARG